MSRVTLILLLCLASISVSRADILSAVAPDALVVVGDKAPAIEQAAAEKLAQRLRAAGGPADNLVLASEVNVNLEQAATHHLFVVGTPESNRVMQRFPSHWVMNRDLYYATHRVFPDYTPTHGFFAAGYGTFNAGDVGYIEWDRNPYWHYATNLGITPGGNTPVAPNLPYRQIIRLTGNTSAGTAMAVDAFLSRKILTGVITANGDLPGPMSLWTLDTAHYALPEQAPAWLPAQGAKDGDLSLDFAGWQLADSMTYSGFQDASGLSARRIWRLKYLTEKGWNYPLNVVIDPAHPMTRSPLFEASLDRRASDNELLVAEMPSPAAAVEALIGLQKTLDSRGAYSHAPWTKEVVSGIAWQKSRFGTHIGSLGKYVLMESFDTAHSEMGVKMVSDMIATTVERAAAK